METIREYAWERLVESGESERICREHACYYLQLVEDAEPYLTSGHREAWLKRLEVDHDNLHAALVWSQGSEDGVPLALRLAGALWWFWHFRGYLSHGRDLLEGVLKLEATHQHKRERAEALYGAGSLAWFLSDFCSARRRLEESVALWRELGDERGLAYALNLLGVDALWTHNEEVARHMHVESVSLLYKLGD